MRRLLVVTVVALLTLTLPGVAQAQRGSRTSPGTGGTSRGGFGNTRGGFGNSGSAHAGNRGGLGNGFSSQGYSNSFGSFGRGGSSRPGPTTLGSNGGGIGVYSQDFSRSFDPNAGSFSSSPSGRSTSGGGRSATSSLGMGWQSLNPMGTNASATVSGSGPTRSGYSSLGMGYQNLNAHGTNRGTATTASGSLGSTASPGTGSPSLHSGVSGMSSGVTSTSGSTQQRSVTSTPTTTTQQSTTTAPTPLQILNGPPSQGALGNAGAIEILVPANVALVSVNGAAINSTGTTRYLETPTLTPGTTYSYTVTVAYQNGTQTQTQSQTVQVTSGTVSVANFLNLETNSK